MSKIPIKNLIIGESYFIPNYIFKLRSVVEDNKINSSGHIYLDGNSFCPDSTGCYLTDYTDDKIFRLATEEEKRWLDTCVKENKFIPLKDIPKYPTVNNSYSIY